MTTVTITWLGEPGGSEECVWNGVTFPEGKAVEVDDPFMIKKAKTNPFFEVDGEEKPTKADHLAKARAAKAAKRAM